MAAPSFPLIKGQVPTPGTPVSMALTVDTDPDNPLAGDLHLMNGQIHFWDAQNARRQKIMIVLQFFKGEWWLNRDEGIPYWESVFGKKRTNVILSVFRQALLLLPGMVQIQLLTIDLDTPTRTLTVNFALRYDDGAVITSADFGPVIIKAP